MSAGEMHRLFQEKLFAREMQKRNNQTFKSKKNKHPLSKNILTLRLLVFKSMFKHSVGPQG
ncbi:protein of unknown function [Burkholderia multivorans]